MYADYFRGDKRQRYREKSISDENSTGGDCLNTEMRSSATRQQSVWPARPDYWSALCLIERKSKRREMARFYHYKRHKLLPPLRVKERK